jgi:hypothetical protein
VDAPELQVATGVLLTVFLIGAALQVMRLRGKCPPAVPPLRAQHEAT